MATTYKYSDLDLDFLTNPITKDVSIKYDVAAVKRSLRNLMFTKRNERLFQPNIYGGVLDLLFENFGSIQVVSTRSRIEEMIKEYEPRISDLRVDLQEKQDYNSIVVNVYFKVRNIPGVQELTLELQRVR